MTGGRADMEYYSTARGKLPDELEALLLDERVAAIKQAGLGRNRPGLDGWTSR